MPDMADYLENRARLIGQAFQGVGDDLLWRWRGYDWHEDLNVREFQSGRRVRYQRSKDWKGSIELANVRPVGIDDRRVIEIPTGEPKIVDMLVARGYNYGGVVDVPIHYEGDIRRLRGSSDAFSHGLTQSMEIALKFTQGGEASFAKFEQEVKFGLEARQDWSHGSTEEEEIRRLAGISPEAPARYDVIFRLVRRAQPMKLKVTGRARLDHGVMIGKFDKGWRGNKGKGGKTWPRWAKYDSFLEQCLPAIRGEAPRDVPFAEYFRSHPQPDWLIRRLSEPLDVPFEHTSDEFDGATTIEQDQEVRRGPRPDDEPPAEPSEA